MLWFRCVTLYRKQRSARIISHRLSDCSHGSEATPLNSLRMTIARRTLYSVSTMFVHEIPRDCNWVTAKFDESWKGRSDVKQRNPMILVF